MARRRATLAAAGLAALVWATVPGSGAAHAPVRASASGGAAFTNFEVGENPPASCPGGGQACTNYAAEPAIRSDPGGRFYGSSENGLGAGTIAVRSTDGGAHYTTLTSPDSTSATQATGLAPGGGDTDLATAPVANSSGVYNVYVASLSLANVDVSTSTDGGNTWALHPTSADIPGDDREWIAADQASKVCISYHDATVFDIHVDCSYDAGATFAQDATAIDTSHAYLIDNNEIGNLQIDPGTHDVYQLFSGVASAGDVAAGANYHAVWIAVSTDGGKSFTDRPVYVNPDTSVGYGHQFVNLSVDRAGNLYAVYTDDHNTWYSFSTDHGTTWSGPYRINHGAAATAIFPWSTAGDPGKLDVVFYGTSYYDGTNTPDNYPSSASWYAYFAQNLNALTPGSTFSQVAATPIIHYGGVCESGVTCTGNRDLYDDFGVAADPLTGMASIIYSDDQYTNTAASPPQSGCTLSQSNTVSCDHTSIATQTSGSGIYSSTTTAKRK